MGYEINQGDNSRAAGRDYFENQKNYFFGFQLDWIFNKFKNENLNLKQFLFLFFSRTIFYIFAVALFLFPLFSTNKHNISFFEFCGMFVVFVFLCSSIWARIKIKEN